LLARQQDVVAKSLQVFDELLGLARLTAAVGTFEGDE